jgi:hypothetical protein
MPVVHNAMMLIKPSSVNVTGSGSSATINDSGSVTFTSCQSFSLNGVFSSTYDNYIIDCRLVSSKTGKEDVALRMRLSGTDDTTASSYVSQRLRSDDSTVSGARITNTYGLIISTEKDVQAEGFTAYVYGPGLAQPTAWRSVTVNGDSGAGIDDYASTHNQSTPYDGFTVAPIGGFNVTGLIKVYGLRQ